MRLWCGRNQTAAVSTHAQRQAYLSFLVAGGVLRNPLAVDLADDAQTNIRTLEKQLVCRQWLDMEVVIAARIRAHIDNLASLAYLHVNNALHGFCAILAAIPFLPHLRRLDDKTQRIEDERRDN